MVRCKTATKPASRKTTKSYALGPSHHRTVAAIPTPLDTFVMSSTSSNGESLDDLHVESPTNSNTGSKICPLPRIAHCPDYLLPNVNMEAPIPQELRNSSGEGRFHREDQMMKEYAASALAAGDIDEAQAAILSIPWHTKGVLDNTGRWDEKYLDPAKKETSYVMMSYEEAKRIQRRKDAAQIKWLADWRAGIIDEEGNRIQEPATKSTKAASPTVEDEDLKEEEAEASDSQQSSSSPPSLPKPTHLGGGPRSHTPAPLRQPALTSTCPPKLLAPVLPKTAQALKPKALIVDEPVPDFHQYNYNQLVALCRKRGLRSGGGTQTVRTRLIQDEISVLNGTERKHLQMSKGSNSRAYKTEAPEVPLAGEKRRRGAESEGDKVRQIVEKRGKVI